MSWRLSLSLALFIITGMWPQMEQKHEVRRGQRPTGFVQYEHAGSAMHVVLPHHTPHYLHHIVRFELRLWTMVDGISSSWVSRNGSPSVRSRRATTARRRVLFGFDIFVRIKVYVAKGTCIILYFIKTLKRSGSMDPGGGIPRVLSIVSAQGTGRRILGNERCSS